MADLTRSISDSGVRWGRGGERQAHLAEISRGEKREVQSVSGLDPFLYYLFINIPLIKLGLT